MPLVVGNLLADPAANSFISLTDATAYLQDEASGALPPSGLGNWMTAPESDQESSLVRASRWMAVSVQWCCNVLSAADLVRVGHVTARLAVVALDADLWAAQDLSPAAKRYKADTVEIEYFDASAVKGLKAGGKAFPWIYPMLRGLACGGGSQRDVVRR